MSATNFLSDNEGIRKAAIFLSSLDRDVAVKILNQLDHELALNIRLELISIDHIENETRKNILTEFIEGQLFQRKIHHKKTNESFHKSDDFQADQKWNVVEGLADPEELAEDLISSDFTNGENNRNPISEETENSTSLIRLFDESDLIQEDTLEIENEDVLTDSEEFEFNRKENVFEGNVRTSIPFERKAEEKSHEFDFLSVLGTKKVAEILEPERASVIAIILKNFSEDFRNKILTCFLPLKRKEIEEKLNHFGFPNPLLVKEIENEIYQACYCSQCNIHKV